MPQLNEKAELREKLRQTKECHKCNGTNRLYIHDWKVWCRTCLDIEQYPKLAHLSQEARDELRQKAVQGETTVPLVNAKNLMGRIGF